MANETEKKGTEKKGGMSNTEAVERLAGAGVILIGAPLAVFGTCLLLKTSVLTAIGATAVGAAAAGYKVGKDSDEIALALETLGKELEQMKEEIKSVKKEG